MRQRCHWVGADPLMIAYHDHEWGVPVHDDRKLFEKLMLDMFQAGLSWRTILHKRDNFLKAFKGFEPQRVAAFGVRDVERLLSDDGIVRNRLKVAAAVQNARSYLDLAGNGVRFSDFLWQFVGGDTIQNVWCRLEDIPAKTPESEAMSRELQACGFRFVGPTICYAFMQAVGMVNDHLVDCFRYRELGGCGSQH